MASGRGTAVGAAPTAAPAQHFGRVALHAACLHGKEDIVSLLLKAGADPDAEDVRWRAGTGAVPLPDARPCRRSALRTPRCTWRPSVRARSASPSCWPTARTWTRRTCVHCAGSCTPFLRASRVPDPRPYPRREAVQSKGLTALMLAARARQEETLSLLISHAEFPEHVDVRARRPHAPPHCARPPSQQIPSPGAGQGVERAALRRVAGPGGGCAGAAGARGELVAKDEGAQRRVPGGGTLA